MHKQHHPRRISILTTGLARGGAEIQVVSLAKGLKKRGWLVSVESMLPPKAFVEDLAAWEIPVCSLGMQRGLPNPLAIWRLAQRWRSFRPNVVHCHMVHANLLGRITRILSPVQVLIATAHNTWEGARWRDWAYRITEPLGDLTTNVSQAALERYVRDKVTSRRRSIYMPNGIDTGLFAPDPAIRQGKRRELGWHEEFVWLAVGNLRTAKDYPNLLRAFGELQQKRPGIRLAIAGSGELLPALQAQVRALQLGDRVQFLGERTDVRELMQAADGFAMSSEWEGLPLVLIEASASALPIVATKVGGNGEVVEEGQTGFLVPPLNAHALAEAMERVTSLGAMDRQRLGAAGRKRAEAFYGIEHILSKWENIYEQLLQVNAPRRHYGWGRTGLLLEGVRQWRRN